MANIRIPRSWESPEIKPVEESVYHNRRKILKQLGFLTTGIALTPLLPGCSSDAPGVTEVPDTTEPPTINTGNSFTFPGMENFYPAELNNKYTLDRTLTKEFDATHYNNFYEFIHPEDLNIYNTFKYISAFDTRDWQISVEGLADNTGSFHLGDLITEMGLEERTYRHRCVEAWAMAVPWTGFSFEKLIRFFQPQNSATHILMTSFADPEQQIGVKTQDFYPWPYFEALSMAEAMNELAFIGTGLFGKPMPKQNGAPVRLIVPWKYGFKSIKSIVKIEFVDFSPKTFWNTAVPLEYGVVANVDPDVPHPRWSQATEIMIPNGSPRPTRKYNGYGEFVAHLYE